MRWVVTILIMSSVTVMAKKNKNVFQRLFKEKKIELKEEEQDDAGIVMMRAQKEELDTAKRELEQAEASVQTLEADKETLGREIQLTNEHYEALERENIKAQTRYVEALRKEVALAGEKWNANLEGTVLVQERKLKEEIAAIDGGCTAHTIEDEVETKLEAERRVLRGSLEEQWQLELTKAQERAKVLEDRKPKIEHELYYIATHYQRLYRDTKKVSIKAAAPFAIPEGESSPAKQLEQECKSTQSKVNALELEKLRLDVAIERETLRGNMSRETIDQLVSREVENRLALEKSAMEEHVEQKGQWKEAMRNCEEKCALMEEWCGSC
jgi:vacuolar-type H+-ATPase subunit D/Vma8